MINFTVERLKILKLEKRHVRIILMMKICMTVTFFSIYFLPPHHAAWVSGLTNFIWLWEF